MDGPTDFVVVLPGIMGSTLVKDGVPVWALTPGALFNALTTLGRNLERITLSYSPGRDPSDDGVTAGALMPDLHLIPGLWTPMHGYDTLTEALVRWGYLPANTTDKAEPGNLLLFPYDWRLSSRVNGRRLAESVHDSLDRWRRSSSARKRAKVTLIAHSMGGQVARAYMAFYDGGADTRKLITLGTPWRGAAIALKQLAEGVPRPLGPLRDPLNAFMRSMPSMYELLPSYACILGGQEPEFLASAAEDIVIPNVTNSAERIRTGLGLHADLEAAEDGSAFAEQRFLIRGDRQRTITGATLDAGSLTFSEALDPLGSPIEADGTVPLPAGPRNLDAHDKIWHLYADKHGHLPSNPDVLGQVHDALRPPTIFKIAKPPIGAQVDAEEFLPVGTPFDVSVTAANLLEARVTLTHESGNPAQSDTSEAVDGQANFIFPSLQPGAWTVSVSGRTASNAIAAVVSAVFVCPTDGVTID